MADSRTLAKDERGAIMVLGLFMSVLLVGVLWYVIGLANVMVFRERMQEAADSTAFSGAVVHAHAMNLIVLLNMVMAALMAVLITLRMIQLILYGAGALMAAAYAATLGMFTPFLTASEKLLEGGQKMNDVIKQTKGFVLPAIGAVAKAQTVAAAVTPALAEGEAIYISKQFGTPVGMGVIASATMNPNPPARQHRGLPIADGTYMKLCSKGGEIADDMRKGLEQIFVDLLLKPIPDELGIKGFITGAIEAIHGLVSSLVGDVSSVFCQESYDIEAEEKGLTRQQAEDLRKRDLGKILAKLSNMAWHRCMTEMDNFERDWTTENGVRRFQASENGYGRNHVRFEKWLQTCVAGIVGGNVTNPLFTPATREQVKRRIYDCLDAENGLRANGPDEWEWACHAHPGPYHDCSSAGCGDKEGCPMPARNDHATWADCEQWPGFRYDFAGCHYEYYKKLVEEMHICGDEGGHATREEIEAAKKRRPKKVADKAQNGTLDFFIWGVVEGDTSRLDTASRFLEIGNWDNRRVEKNAAVETVARFATAGAEFFYDCPGAGPASSAPVSSGSAPSAPLSPGAWEQCNVAEEAMWNMRWRARLRRTPLPGDFNPRDFLGMGSDVLGTLGVGSEHANTLGGAGNPAKTLEGVVRDSNGSKVPGAQAPDEGLMDKVNKIWSP